MAEIVNLRRARKARARAERAGAAEARALRHGVPKAERDRAGAEARTARRRLDGHALEGGDGDDPDAPTGR